jgi:hypothetical protein
MNNPFDVDVQSASLTWEEFIHRQRKWLNNSYFVNESLRMTVILPGS